MYSLFSKLLFNLEPERAHTLSLSALKYVPKSFFPVPDCKKIKALGLEFAHPVGLAAGLDKNGEYIDALAKIGFSFIEVGTVTPKAQGGNPRPRLFRLPEAHALINRMGFNNHGVDTLIDNIKKANFTGILGVNIGKNKDTPLEKANEDYLYCLRKVYPYAAYITVNISSPNTPDLRKLQQGDYLDSLLKILRREQLYLANEHSRHVPLLIKLSPDESAEDLKRMADIIVENKMEGIIATNTTNERFQVEGFANAKESGGLSGVPLREKSTQCLQVIKNTVGNDVLLIGVGGIDSPESAQEKLNAGASLVQVYTGFVYQGPRLIRDIVNFSC